jgi:hypothetical protein
MDEKLFVQALNKVLHDETVNNTNMLSLIDILLDKEDCKIDSRKLLWLKVYFNGRLNLFQMEIEGKTTSDIYYGLRDQFGV